MKLKVLTRTFLFLLASALFFSQPSYAKSAKEIDASVDTALDYFKQNVFAGSDMLTKAKGVLVLNPVYKAGIGLGGEYGTGALTINGKTVDYYNIIGASLGFQWGGQAQKVYLLFMEDKALRDFRMSDGWTLGVDASVALITVGADGSIDTTKTNAPILAFVMNQKGLMLNLTVEGSKLNKIKPN